MDRKAKFAKVFDERIRSFIDDNYCKRVDARLPNMWIVKLKHRLNGNSIRLLGDPVKAIIMQYTNDKFTHTEQVV